MLHWNDKFTEVLPRLEPLHEGADPAQLLILYFEPRTLHDKAAWAVKTAKHTQDMINLGTQLTDEWAALSNSREDPATPSDSEPKEEMDDELRQLMADEYDKLAHEAREEMEEYWEEYPEIAKEAAIGRLVLREQLRLGLRRRLIHALAGAAISAAVFVPPSYAGIEIINDQDTSTSDTQTDEQDWTTGQKAAEVLVAGSAALLGGMISFSTHGRAAGNRVARKKMLKKFGSPKYGEL